MQLKDQIKQTHRNGEKTIKALKENLKLFPWSTWFKINEGRGQIEEKNRGHGEKRSKTSEQHNFVSEMSSDKVKGRREESNG